MTRNLQPRQFTHTLIDAQSPTCVGCGEQIRYNTKAAGQPSVRDPEKILNGWSHRDGMLRDHEAAPPFGVSGEDEMTRTNAKLDQARMQVREQLNRNMAEYALGKAADDAVRGR